MNWEAIGAIGEIVGAAAVVITLGFLIYQLRQNTITIRQQSARESTSALQRLSIAMLDPASAGSVAKAYTEVDPDLTWAEMVQIEHFMLAYLLVFQQDYFDWKRGLQPSPLWESRVPIIEAVFVSHLTRKWWDTTGRAYFTSPFQQLIDQMLTEEPPAESDYWRPSTSGPNG